MGLSEHQIEALIELGFILKENAYSFTTISPESHKRYLKRSRENGEAPAREQGLRDLLGWNKAVPSEFIPEKIKNRLKEAGMLSQEGELIKSKIRFSTFENFCFIHSGYPTEDEDAVFFGPDSYRFMRFLKHHHRPFKSLIDVGCGSGVGGIFISSLSPVARSAQKVYLCDINPLALDFSKINSRINGLAAPELLQSDLFESVKEPVDLIIANPPFMIDATKRAYRHGGERHGMDLSIKIVEKSVKQLNPGGSLLLYTAAAVTQGVDVFRRGIDFILSSPDIDFKYEEIDPDIFGEEIKGEAYQDVERLAAVGLVLTKA